MTRQSSRGCLDADEIGQRSISLCPERLVALLVGVVEADDKIDVLHGNICQASCFFGRSC